MENFKKNQRKLGKNKKLLKIKKGNNQIAKENKENYENHQEKREREQIREHEKKVK